MTFEHARVLVTGAAPGLGAALGFTETTGDELASAGVHVHAVCPSYFRTNLVASMEGSDQAARLERTG